MNSVTCACAILLFLSIATLESAKGTTHGKSCEFHFQCDPFGILKCVKSICACPQLLHEFNGLTCHYEKRKTFNEQCNPKVPNECMSERNLHCIESAISGISGSCACAPDREWKRGICQLENPTTPPIACPDEETFVPGSTTCKLKGGGYCYDIQTEGWRHDLCASGLCLGEDEPHSTQRSRCTCTKDENAKRFFVIPSDDLVECKYDYDGLRCNPNNSLECDHGLECLEKPDVGWVCACPDQKSFVQGRCLLKDKKIGESCGDTVLCNNTDHDIGCEFDEKDRRYKCTCHPKRKNLPNGTTVFVQMAWSSHPHAPDCEPSGVAGVPIQTIKLFIIAAMFISLTLPQA